MGFDQSDHTVADSNDVTLLDEVCVFAFEKGFCGGSFIGDCAVNLGYFLSITGVDDTVFCSDYLNVDVVAIT